MCYAKICALRHSICWTEHGSFWKLFLRRESSSFEPAALVNWWFNQPQKSFFLSLSPSGMYLKYICFQYTHFHIIRGVKALQAKRATMFRWYSSCLSGLIQPVFVIWLEQWPRWHPQLQLPFKNTLNTLLFISFICPAVFHHLFLFYFNIFLNSPLHVYFVWDWDLRFKRIYFKYLWIHSAIFEKQLVIRFRQDFFLSI